VEGEELESGSGGLFELSPVYESKKFVLLFMSSLQITNINLQIVYKSPVSLAKCNFYIFFYLFSYLFNIIYLLRQNFYFHVQILNGLLKVK